MSNKSKVNILPKVKTVKPPKMKRPRRKNICTCGRKMNKYIDDCVHCGGEEYYECPSLKCAKMFALNGEEI